MINDLPQAQPENVEIFKHSDVGLFEINDAGTVLYCRTTPEKIFSEKSAAVGRNFFDEVAPFENMEELRWRFNSFIKSCALNENFSFNCRIKSQNIPAKVLLMRIPEQFHNERTDTTIVDIRKI